MASNLPWLKSRLKIIYALFFDLFIICLTFSYLNSKILSKIAHENIILFYLTFSIVWILSSYILGRYIFIDKKISIYFFKKFILNISCFLISIATTFGFNLIIDFNFIFSISELSLIKFFLISNFNLLIYQLLFYKILLNEKDIWIFWGTKKSFIYLNKLIKKEDINFEVFSKSKLKSIKSSLVKNKKIGIIIENIDEISQKDYLRLINYKEKGLYCISLQDWIEKHLERLESNLLKEKFLILNGFYFPNNSLQFRLKRLGDLIISILLLLTTSPIVIICGVLIYIEDRRPIFYSQLRTGFAGKYFRVYKLRSMKINAEQSGPKWSLKGDVRVTKVGSFIRKFRIDELPQLFSVIKGEMSLIGPRPERPVFDKELQKLNSNYKYRYFIRPGLSGWAQVKYPYGASTFDAMNKLSYDLYYIRNFSNLLDLVILFKTIKLLLRAEGYTSQEPKEIYSNNYFGK